MSDSSARESATSGFGETFAGWCALVAIVLFYLAMGPGFGFIPPLSPLLSAEDFARHYSERAVAVRIGSVMLMTGAALMFPLFGAMSAAMLRMKGRPLALSATQLGTAIVTFAPLFMSSFFFAAASFREERAAADVLALSDVGWFFLVMPTPAVLIQLVVFGIAILGDDKARPVFPRWLAYFNFWVGVLFFAGVFIPIFKTGPFAWDGLLAFWIPFLVFGLWIAVMAWQFIRLGGQPARGERS